MKDSSNNVPDATELNDNEIRRVLRRATELDDKQRSVTAGELTDIAEEVGISRGALHEALREEVESRNVGGAVAEGARRSVLPSWVKYPLTFSIGALLGGAPSLGTDISVYKELSGLALFGMIAGSILLTIAERRESKRSALGNLINGWIGYVLAMGVFHVNGGPPVGDFYAVVIPAGIATVTVCAGVRALLTKLRSSPHPAEETADN